MYVALPYTSNHASLEARRTMRAQTLQGTQGAGLQQLGATGGGGCG